MKAALAAVILAALPGALRAQTPPSALVGLTAINGADPSFMLADAAPALSQSIIPIWTGLHTFTGGLMLTGPPSITETFATVSGNFSIYGEVNATQPALMEQAAHFGIISSVGSGDITGDYKMGLSDDCTALAGSASCWSHNSVARIMAGGTKRGGVGDEIDLRNDWGSYPGFPSNPYAVNLMLTGSNAGGYAQAAIGIAFAGSSTPMWNYGIYFGETGRVFNSATLLDRTNSPEFAQVQGSHGVALDTTQCVCNYGFLARNNQVAVAALNTGTTALNLIMLDSANKVELGSIWSTWIQANSSIVPSSDAYLVLGTPAYRWGGIYSSNGTIQTSDRRAKTDIANLPPSLPIIMAVEPKTYRRIDDKDQRTHWGLIAQDIDAAIPKTIDFGGVDKPADGSLWGLNYAETNAILWGAAREQQDEIKALRARLDRLEHASAP